MPGPLSPLTLQHYERGISGNTTELHAVSDVKRCDDKDKDERVDYALNGRPEGEAKACPEGTECDSIRRGARA